MIMHNKENNWSLPTDILFVANFHNTHHLIDTLKSKRNAFNTNRNQLPSSAITEFQSVSSNIFVNDSQFAAEHE
jgi:hypothetical protein